MKKFFTLCSRVGFETPIPDCGFKDIASACQVVTESGTRKVKFCWFVLKRCKNVMLKSNPSFSDTCWGLYQRWSPRGRPRGHILKSLALALASKPQVLGLGLGLEALGPRKLPCPRLEDSTIFEPLKFCWKRQKPRRKFVNTFFILRNWSVGLAKRASPPNWNFTDDKNVTKKPIVSSVSVSF